MADSANNTKSWRDAAEELAAQLAAVTKERDELLAERDELAGRLEEIAAIAAPDEDPERLNRIEVLVQQLAAKAGIELQPEPAGDTPE